MELQGDRWTNEYAPPGQRAASGYDQSDDPLSITRREDVQRLRAIAQERFIRVR
ncbi:MAG: hypothetical protein MUC48_16845 [Leptolyngbya sp. Prado105]|jgi:hypothetical protein|nr:hypothetical protein [Leptolyngbya sp. Prado105]